MSFICYSQQHITHTVVQHSTALYITNICICLPIPYTYINIILYHSTIYIINYYNQHAILSIYGHQHHNIHMHNSIGIRYVIFLVVMALMSVCYEDAISLPYDGCSIYLLTWMVVTWTELAHRSEYYYTRSKRSLRGHRSVAEVVCMK